MPTPPLTTEIVTERVGIWEGEGRNISAAARTLGISRNALRHSLNFAREKGLISDQDLHERNAPKADEYKTARARMIDSYQRKQRKGDWRKPCLVRVAPGPFRLKVFGDPHLDADGCNYELFEKHWLEMSVEDRVFGVCVGDWFNNWRQALAHLWKDEITSPSDAWACLEYLMEEKGDALLAACSGNHDDWTQAPADPVDLLMKRHGVVYRKGAIRAAIQAGDADPIMAAIRHKWKGHSMYSAAHGMVRANREGWRDHLMIGGHIHQDEKRMVSHPDGFHAHVCQVSAFKEFDDYVDVHGFNGPRISPVWDLVIDPERDDTDPDKIHVFWDSTLAEKHLKAIQ